MKTPTRALVSWDPAASAPPRDRRFGRERWIALALLAATLAVFAAFVSVLQGVMQRAELQRAASRERAVAEAACESTRAAGQRAGCLALLGRTPDGAADEDGASAAATIHASYGGVPTAAVTSGGMQ